MGWRSRLVLRRARDQVAVLAPVAAVALVAATLLGASALLVAGTRDDAVVAALQRVDEEALDVTVTLRPGDEDPEAVLDAARAAVDRTLGALAADTEVWRTGPLHRLPGRTAGGTPPLAYPAAYPATAEHARLVAGTWPDRARDAAGHVPVAVPSVAAERYGWQPGTVLPVSSTRRAPDDTWVVVGVHELTGPAGTWERDRFGGRVHEPEMPVPGGSASATDGWGPVVVDPAALAAPGTVEQLELVVAPRPASATPGVVAALGRTLPDLRLALADELGTRDAGVAVRTRLDRTVAGTARELAVTGVGVVVVAALLAALATTVMVLAARRLGERRAGEAELLAARGATPRQLRSLAALEAAGTGLVLAVAAPWCARALYALLVARGPLGEAGLHVPAGVPGALLAACGAVAAVLAVALVVPQWHAAGSSAPTPHAGLLRAGGDVVLAAAAAIAVWQLLSYGTPVATGAGLPRVDVVPAVAPALATLGAAVLTLRLVPVVARVADALARRGRSLVGPLAAWQVARRPAATGGAVVVVVLAVASSTFALAFHGTWRVSQAQQSDLAVGTDVRLDGVDADGVTGARPVGDALAAHPDVVGTPVAARDVSLGRGRGALRASAQDARLLAVGTASSAVLRGGSVPWADVVAPLAPEPVRTGVPLPGDPGWVVVDAAVAQEVPAAGRALVELVLQDAHGVRTRVHDELADVREPGELWFAVPAMTPPVQVVALSARVRLDAAPAAAPAAAPDLADGAAQAGDWTTRLGVTLTAARTADQGTERGAAAPGGAPVDLSPVAAWTGTGSSPYSSRPAEVTAGTAEVVVAAPLDPGALADPEIGGRLAVAAWPRPAALPAVLTRSLAEQAGVEEGGTAVLQVGGVAATVEVTDVVPYLPGLPRGGGVLVDRDSLERLLVTAGSAEPVLDGWWFAAPSDATARAFAGTLRTAGVGDVTVGADERVTATQGPLRVGVPVALHLVVVGAALLVVVGLGAGAAATVGSRRLELARLQALGAGRGEVVRGVLAEHALPVAVGAATGLAVGLGLAHLVAPVLTVSAGGLPPVPVPVVRWAWEQQLALTGALAAGACLAVALVAAVLVRRASGALLRLGDDR